MADRKQREREKKEGTRNKLPNPSILMTYFPARFNFLKFSEPPKIAPPVGDQASNTCSNNNRLHLISTRLSFLASS
jgi:hypothetical protein